MVDPTWIHTCPCGERVRVNQLGQHSHTDCEHNPLHPGCCNDPSLRRIWYANPTSGVRCENCGKVWDGDPETKVKAMASHLVRDYEVPTGPIRGEVQLSNERAIRKEIPSEWWLE